MLHFQYQIFKIQNCNKIIIFKKLSILWIPHSAQKWLIMFENVVDFVLKPGNISIQLLLKMWLNNTSWKYPV